MQEPTDGAAALHALIRREIAGAGGWLSFERFMALALYAPGLGYYANERPKFGRMPQGDDRGEAAGSDFVTAPELSALFGRALAVQLAQALDQTGTDTLYEFGAGSGALAAQLLEALGERVRRYCIVDLSGTLRERQAERLAAWGGRVQWLDALPDAIDGVVIGNEVLDAMPVQLVQRDAQGPGWHELGVLIREQGGAQRLALAPRPGAQDAQDPSLAPPLEPDALAVLGPGYTTELHAQAEGFMRTLAALLRRGAIFLIDYGFPAAEYYHPQRRGGTLMCHHLHRSDTDPLDRIGAKDITAHVDFTGIALAGQDAGLAVLGYTSQAHFLINCGLPEMMAAADLGARVMAHRLIAEHEMGELFKVIGFAAGPEFDAIGFRAGDRSHSL